MILYGNFYPFLDQEHTSFSPSHGRNLTKNMRQETLGSIVHHLIPKH